MTAVTGTTAFAVPVPVVVVLAAVSDAHFVDGHPTTDPVAVLLAACPLTYASAGSGTSNGASIAVTATTQGPIRTVPRPFRCVEGLPAPRQTLRRLRTIR